MKVTRDADGNIVSTTTTSHTTTKHGLQWIGLFIAIVILVSLAMSVLHL